MSYTKTKIYLSIILAVAIIVTVIMVVKTQKTYSNADSLANIPETAYSVLSINGISKFIKSTDTLSYRSILTQTIFSQAKEANYDSLIVLLSANDDNKKLLNARILVSYHHSSTDEAKTLATANLHDYKTQKGLEKIISSSTHLVHKDGKNTIFELKFTDDNPIYLAFKQGTIILSPSIELLKESLALNQQSSLAADSNFASSFKTISSSTTASIIVNISKLHQKFENLITNEEIKYLDTENPWIELDLEFTNRGILANGLLKPTNDSFVAQGIQPRNNEKSPMADYVPYSSSGVVLYSSISNSISEELTASISKHKELSEKDKITAKLLSNPMAQYEIMIDAKNEKCIVISAPDSAATIKLIENQHHTSTTNISPKEGVSITCHQISSSELLSKVSKYYFKNSKSQYYCWYNKTLIIASSPKIIAHNIASRINGGTLSKNDDYREVVKPLSNRHQMLLYKDFNLIDTLWAIEKYDANNLFNKLGNSAIQLSSAGKMMYLSYSALYGTMPKKESMLQWELKPDTTLATPPLSVKNHNTGEEEILFMDNASNLYLVNKNGIVIWKKNLTKGTTSRITQIDIYRNGKLQYLFNDNENIYLIDRNGNHVAPFPIKLPAEATNNVTVFDYDKDGEYRFFIACADKQIYVFDKKGKQVTGFNPKPTENNIITDIAHFRSSGKDYIVFHDDLKIRITDRRGADRIIVNNNTIPAAKASFSIIKKDTPEASIVTLSEKDELININLKKQTTEAKGLLFDDYSNSHLISIPTQKRFILLMADKLSIVNEDGKIEFSNDVKTSKIGEAALIKNRLNSDIIAFTDTAENNIYVTDKNGVLYNELPIKGMKLPAVIEHKEKENYLLIVYYSEDGTITAIKIEK